MDAVSATIAAGGQALIQLNIEANIYFYFNLMNLVTPRDVGLNKICARPLTP